MLQKYQSLDNANQGGSPRAQLDALGDERMPGPATPTTFRGQCYLNRERLEKKRARKGISRLHEGSKTSQGKATREAANVSKATREAANVNNLERMFISQPDDCSEAASSDNQSQLSSQLSLP